MSVQNTIIIPKYGMPGLAYEQKYCTMWDIKADFPELALVFPHKIEINKDFADKLKVAFINLKQQGLLGQLHSFDGCLVPRNTRGTSVPSLHSWAMAMDVNAKDNQLKFSHELNPFDHTTFTKSFIDIMVAAGIYWGGYYSNRFDPMHFSCYNG